MLKQMNIAGMILEDDNKSFFLLLKETGGATIISIQIDQVQAESIAAAMNTSFARSPDPYDFLSTIMGSFGLKITRVVIRDTIRFTKNTDVFLNDGEKEVQIESFAGDGVVAALRVNAPIFIENDLLSISDKTELWKWLNEIKPSDFGEN